MSLINDALKRASQSDKERRAACTGAPMLAVEAAPKRSRLPIVLCIAAGFALCISGFFVWRATTPKPHKAVPRRPAVVQAGKKPVLAASQAPVQKINRAQAPMAVKPPAPAVQQTVSTAAPISRQRPGAAPVSPPAAKAVLFPDLHVKAIIFRSKDPLAIINGRTVGIGDVVEEAQVVKIEHQSVRIKFKGQFRDIPME